MTGVVEPYATIGPQTRFRAAPLSPDELRSVGASVHSEDDAHFGCEQGIVLQENEGGGGVYVCGGRVFVG